jgi:glycosyltransferase involved in cell wall biosynthesis
MHKIATSLANAGYDVLLLGRNRKRSLPLKPAIYKQHRLNCFFDKGKFFYIEFNIRLFFYLLFNAFDIVNAIDLDTILPCYLVSRIKQKPCVYDAHEYFTEVPEVINRPFTQRIWLAIEQFIVPKLKHCYTVSDSIAQLFDAKYHTRFQTIRNVPYLIDQHFSADTSIHKERYILYQGALNKGRGLAQLIEAMQWIDCQLVLVGEGDLSEDLRLQVQTLQLQNKIIFKGFIAPENLNPITQNAYIGINVSENLGLSYYYSLNNKCFDYIHAELPSITNNFPEYQQINSKHEVAVMCELTTQNLVQAINLLLNDVQLHARLVTNCKAAKMEYNWQKESQKLLTIYRSVATI